MSKKIFISQLASPCAYGSSATTQVFNFFKNNGYEICSKPKNADTLLLNICGLLNENWLEQLSAIKQYINLYEKKKIIIFGCLMKREKSILDIAKNKENIIFFDSTELTNFNKLFSHKIPINKIQANIIKKEFLHKRDRSKKFFNIIISTGCTNFCSYCTYALTRGIVKSKSINQIIKEIKSGLKQGFKNFYLYADEFGSYGRDINTNVIELFEKISRIKTKTKFTISFENFNPQKFVYFFKQLKPFLSLLQIKFIDIPIQSGSKRILKLMNRKYSSKVVVKYIKELKEASPDTTITTDIIYCFPTETREDFNNSLKLIKYFDFATFHKYEKKYYAISSFIPERINSKEKKYRENLISELRNNFKDKKILRPYC